MKRNFLHLYGVLGLGLLGGCASPQSDEITAPGGGHTIRFRTARRTTYLLRAARRRLADRPLGARLRVERRLAGRRLPGNEDQTPLLRRQLGAALGRGQPRAEPLQRDDRRAGAAVGESPPAGDRLPGLRRRRGAALPLPRAAAGQRGDSGRTDGVRPAGRFARLVDPLGHGGLRGDLQAEAARLDRNAGRARHGADAGQPLPGPARGGADGLRLPQPALRLHGAPAQLPDPLEIGRQGLRPRPLPLPLAHDDHRRKSRATCSSRA